MPDVMRAADCADGDGKVSLMRSVLLAVLLLLPGIGWAQFFDGKTLLMMCTSEPRSFAEGGCVGFVAGISDSLKAAENRRAPNDRVCVPPEMTTMELRDTVVKYLNLVPQFQEYQASFLVEMALLSAYPCNPRQLAETEKSPTPVGS